MSRIISKKKKFKEIIESSLYQYPFQNLSLIDMEGEVWKPLPDYEDYIMISNLGRVKSLPHLIEFTAPGKATHRHFTKEMIRKQVITTIHNKSINEVRQQLSFAFKIKSENIKKCFLVARAVYMTFVSKDEVAKVHYTYMKHYDNDPFNNRVENLYVVSGKELHHDIFKNNRSDSFRKFRLYMDNYTKTKQEEEIKSEERKEQVSLSGPYPYQNMSLTDMKGEIWKPMAGAETHYMVSNMGRIKRLPIFHPNHKTPRSKNPTAYWSKEKICGQTIENRYNTYLKQVRSVLRLKTHRMVKERYVSRIVYSTFVRPIKKGEMVLPKDKNPYNNRVENLYVSSDKKVISKYRLNPVTQYDREGNVLQTFESIAEAATKLNLNHGSIANVVRGVQTTAGGYLWRKGVNTEKIDVSELGVHPRLKRASVCRKVAKYDQAGNLLEIYPSIKDAAKQNNCPLCRIKSYLLGIKPIKKEYHWEYADCTT